MTRRLLVPLALVSISAAVLSAQRFRAGIDVVSLNVTVADPAGRFVRDLERGDFEVYEDGVRQDISYFSRVQQPIALAILLDTSASMEDKLALAQEAATGFVQRLRKEDLAEVVDFDSRVQILQTFTNDRDALEKAIRSTTADGSTAIYHAIYVSLKELKKIRAESTSDIRRQAIVVLSDGEDTSSILGYDEVEDLAKRSETAIYTIGLRGADLTAHGFKEAEYVMRQFAQQTGGRSFFPQSAAELPKIYDQISDELASQYAIAYTSKNMRRDGLWRRIVVRTTRANVVARTKQGYYAPTSRATE